MALTLTNSIDATQREFAVTGTVTIEPGYRFRLGDELLELQGFVQPRNTVHVVRNLWYVRRGLDLSTAATHANGTEVKGATDAFVSATSGTTPPDPFADGGSGGPVAASDVSVSPEVAGASDVQGALEGLAGRSAVVAGAEAFDVLQLGLPQLTDILVATPELLAFGWQALHDYAADLGSADGVQLLKPATDANVWTAEVITSGLTGATEPDWSSSPNVGDTVSDGAVLWYNAGPYSSFPPTTVFWTPDTMFGVLVVVSPDPPIGTLFLGFPPSVTTDPVTQPDWTTATSFGEYVADLAGYWMNAGSADYVPVWGAPSRLTGPVTFEDTAAFLDDVSLASLAYAGSDGLVINGNDGYTPLELRVPGDATANVDIQLEVAGNGNRMLGYRAFTFDFDEALHLASGGTNTNVGLSIRQIGAGGDGTVGVVIGAAATEPADGDLSAGETAIWLDPDDMTPSLNFKAKTANGTVVTATLPLT